MVLSSDFVRLRSLLFLIFGGWDNTDSVRIFLYDSWGSNGTVIPSGNFSLIDPNSEVIILIHGFNSVYTDFQSICQLHKLKNGNMTVLNLDWQQQAEGLNYIKASKNVDMVGKYLGKWIVDAKINPTKVRIMGNSLGAHVAGFAAKKVFAETGMKIKEVRGEDPAGPFFSFFALLPANLRLDASDAQSVLCVHTNRYLLGITFDIGSTNVYVNNAWLQPGCEKEFRFALCSHYFAVRLHGNVILDPTYVAHRISGFSIWNKPEGINRNDSVIMGEDLPLDKRGMYYLETDDLYF